MQYLKKVEEPFSITFKDINYQMDIFDKKSNETISKVILNNVSGTVKSGQISAIMGPSGSGKTSLLNFLTDRIQFSKLSKHSGKIFINSEEVDFKELADYSGYVMQDDILFDVLTPQESIRIGCRLRKLVDDDKVEDAVNAFLDDLQLVACKNTKIGNPEQKGVSGGERKRTSIGMELISNPSILFLDEPTSGLDSQTSLKTINLLKKIAQEKNILIVCTIHQPSSNIFNLFDKLFIVEKGNLVYTGSPTKIGDYFETINRPLPILSNPADAFMRMMEENNQGKDPRYFIEKFDEKMKKIIESEIENELGTTLKKNIESKTLDSASFFEASKILANRALINILRNPTLLRMRVFMTLLFCFIIASVFWQLDGRTYEGIYGRTGYIFFLSINLFMTQVMGTVLSFPMERAVFIRENSSKMYTVGSYYFAKNIVETPLVLITSSVLITVSYFTTGLRPDAGYFFLFLLGYVLEALTAQSLGYMLGSLFSNIAAAMGSVNIIVMPFILFAGTLINEESMPRWLFWIKYISPLKYVNEIASVHEFTDNPDITFGGGSSKILESFGYDVGVTNCYIILACMVAGYRVIAMFFLKLMIRKSG